MFEALAFFSLTMNIISGYVRETFKGNKRAQIRCLYVPITIIIIARYFSGVSWKYIPFLILIALLGIIIGGAIHRIRNASEELPDIATPND